jgi:hypothetical protein
VTGLPSNLLNAFGASICSTLPKIEYLGSKLDISLSF